MRPVEQLSLSARLVGFGLVTAVLVSLAGGWVLRGRLHDVVLRSFGQELKVRSERLVVGLSPDGSPRTTSGQRSDEFEHIFSGWYWTLQGEGVARQSRSLWDGYLTGEQADGTPADDPWWRAVGPMGQSLLGRKQQLQLGGKTLTLSVYGLADAIDSERDRIDRVLMAALGSFVVLITLVALIQVRLGLIPLRRLQEALWEVRQGHSERVGNAYGPDLAPLAGEVNAVLERNALLVERSRQHAANLGHALKKPLSILGLAARHDTVPATTVIDQVKNMDRLIAHHLNVAASGAGNVRWMNVNDRLEAIVRLMRQLHASRPLSWSVETEPGLRWKGEATDLEEMAGNLLDNAGKWANSLVRVRATSSPTGWSLLVEDDGQGMSSEQRSAAMQRGMRFDENVTGSGLGLAIARDIARTYGGDLVLRESALGGLCCLLELP